MYAVLNMNYTPSKFADLPQKEKAFVISCIIQKLEAEKREMSKIKMSNAKRKR